MAQRLYLAAGSLGLGAAISQEFYDEDARLFLGLAKTGWEVLCAVAIGGRIEPTEAERALKEEARRRMMGRGGA